MGSGKEIVKAMDRLLKSPDVMNELYSSSQSIIQFNDKLGTILTYYIATRDTKNMNINEITRNYYNLLNENIKNKIKNETVEQALEKNIITNGFVTNSSNGYNRKKIKKYGLGTDKIYDKTLAKDINFLEEKICKSEFLINQKNSCDEIYYSSPGPNSFHYACSYSPERLFMGPLHQERGDALPIIIGETKKEYMIRLANKKVSLIEEKKEKKEILKTYKRVINKLCTSSPSISFIPIKSKNFELNASNAYSTNDKQSTLSQWIDKMADKGIYFFEKSQGGSGSSNMGNLVSIGVKVPPSCIDILEVPDCFEIMQNMAIAKGMKKGDKIDYFTGEKINVEKTLDNNIVSNLGSLPYYKNENEIKIEPKNNLISTNKPQQKNNIGR